MSRGSRRARFVGGQRSRCLLNLERMAELKLDLSRVDQVVKADNADREEAGEGGGEEGEAALDPLTDMYEDLPPLEKLERYFQSEDVLDREVAVRCIADAVEAATTYSEYQLILEISMTLANDHEPTIRMLILEMVAVLLEHHSRLCASDHESDIENKERLFDVPIRMVSDITQQVRQMSQNCIINLLEGPTKDKDMLIAQMLPDMVRCLRKDEQYDLRMDMALLLSRLASLLGQQVIVKYFVPLFPSLGNDAMFHVRKAFAVACRELCPVLGEQLTEAHILKPFLDLCQDDVWGVRKACADVFADVSHCCNLGTRHDRLTPRFLRLLQDDSRWVRKAAFEHLGSFIASFYVPSDSPESFPCEDESSINPFGDSVLMDNSLLSGTLEEDGVWVGPPEPVENKEQSGSGTGMGDQDKSGSGSGMGDQDKSGARTSMGDQKETKEKEPFFYFMSTPSDVENVALVEKKGAGEEEEEKEVRDERENGEKREEEGDEEEMRENTQVLVLRVNKEKSDTVPVSSGAETTPASDSVHPVSLTTERLVLNVREEALNEGENPGNHEEVLNEGDAPSNHEKAPNEGEIPSNHEETPNAGETPSNHEETPNAGETTSNCEQASSEGENPGREETTNEKEDDSNHEEVPNEREPPGNQKEAPSEGESCGTNHEEAQTLEGTDAEKEDSSTVIGNTVLLAAENQGESCGVLSAATEGMEEEREREMLEQRVDETENDTQKSVGNSTENGENRENTGEDVTAASDSSDPATRTRTPVTHEEQTTEVSDKAGQEVEGKEEGKEGEEKEEGEVVKSVEGETCDGGRCSGDSGECCATGEISEDRTNRDKLEGGVDTGSTLGREEPSKEEGGSPSQPTARNFPPVRVLVHTTAGQVVEHTCDLGDDSTGSTCSTVSTHDRTSLHDNVVSMDITLATMSDTRDITIPYSDETQPQEIIPDELMEHYLSMTDTTKSQTVDSDLPYYCAYCLPGVLLTLGAENWPLLRTTFLTLSGDLQWKIRRVLAYSLHELAHILGSQTTVTDLFPIFEEYCTKDVDDVKIGVLSHLAEFFEVLPVSLRHSCLPTILEGLQEVENPKNWRYRHTLVEQLVCMCDFYDADYLHSHIYPIAKQLMQDKVTHIRHSATQLLGTILQRLTRITPDGYLPLLREMKTEYATHKQWNFRQLYITQCRNFLAEQCISSEVFVSECLPSLLALVSDKVPNIRLALARAVRETLANRDYFQTNVQQTVDQLESVLTTLQSDTDRDVVYYAGGDVSLFVGPQQQDLRYRTYSQASEDQYHDAVDTLEGSRGNKSQSGEHEAWLRSWEEALSGPTLQMTGEIR